MSIVNGVARLQDVSGRDLGRAQYKKPLFPGSSLSVGGKDVEVDSKITKSDFLAGKPFLNGFAPSSGAGTSTVFKKPQAPLSIKKEKEAIRELSGQSNQPSTIKKYVPTVFKNPMANRPQNQPPATEMAKPVPRHNPDAPGAIVLPRPTSVPKGKQIVDVVIDPILSKHLRPHQREGVQFLYECVMGMRMSEGQGAILADEMGLGKTLQTITLIWTLLKQNPIYDSGPVAKKILIACPVSLVNNWRKEFRKWLGNDRVGVFVCTDKGARIADFTKGRAYNVMIVGYEKLRSVHEELQNGCKVDLIIADEGHKLKTASNKSLLAIKSFDTDRKVVLSGTPLQNDLSEFYATIDMVNPGILNKYSVFKREFETPIVRSRQPNAPKDIVEKGEARWKELLTMTSQFMLRRTAEVIAKFLPPKTEMIVFCRPTPAQASIYKSVLESPLYRTILGSPDASFQLITMLKKLCNSPALLKNKDEESHSNDLITKIIDNVSGQQLVGGGRISTKLQLLQNLLQRIRKTTDEKVVVVSNYTSTLDLVERVLASLTYTFLRLDGQTPSAKRQGLVDKFNKGSPASNFVFLLSAKAGGTGLNLIGASRIILFDIDWNPATDLQAMARIHRDGQKKPCFIYRLVVQGAIEEKIYQRQVTKMGLADAVVDSKKTAQGFTQDELRDLFRLDESETCPTHDLLACDCNGLGNAQVLPENTPDEIMTFGKGWGTTMNDPDADELSDEVEGPPLGILMSAAKLDIEAQERKVRKMTQHSKEEKQKMLALMQYLHINAAEISAGNEEVEALMEDGVLLDIIKGGSNNVSFVFAKTTG